VPRRLVADRWLFFTAGLLAVAGLFLVGSASHYVAMGGGGSPFGYLAKHAVHLLVGLACMFGVMSIPYRRLQDPRLLRIALVVSVAALVLVRFMPAAGGAHRWFRVGPVTVQPSEFVKLVVLVFAAAVLAERHDRVNERGTLLRIGGWTGTLAFLTAIEPDLGSAVMMVLVPAILLFVAGLRWRTIGYGAAAFVALFVVAVLAEPYRIARIRTFLAPDEDALGAGFQLTQSILAIGSGGVGGVGFGHGMQKAWFLPAAHTDFIYSVLGEEMGLVGCCLLLAGFLLLFWRGLRAALRAPDRFGFHLALGVTCLLVVQALIHMGVCLGLLPTKGLPLPFISYGGSSLVATLAATGLLLNVSQHSG
jgi:cell division protein FtsW